MHVASTVTEWICAAAFCIYLLTFTDEFRDIKISHPKVRLYISFVLIMVFVNKYSFLLDKFEEESRFRLHLFLRMTNELVILFSFLPSQLCNVSFTHSSSL